MFQLKEKHYRYVTPLIPRDVTRKDDPSSFLSCRISILKVFPLFFYLAGFSYGNIFLCLVFPSATSSEQPSSHLWEYNFANPGKLSSLQIITSGDL
jgi:hypothetical protein